MSRAPFSPLRFSELPDAPRRPHPYLGLPVREVVTESPGFGRVRASYRELGEGPPLLLVHGLMTSGYSYRYVVEPLAARYRVVVPDLPGAGDSDMPDAPYTPDAFVAWLDAFARATGTRGERVIGNSMGGYLCMRWALADSGAMSRLVNVHSPGFPEPRLWALFGALRAPGARAVLDRVVALDPERWAHRNVHYWDETLKSREEAREYGRPLSTPEGRRGFLGWLADGMDARALADFAATLQARRRMRAGFPVPLQLVYARQDPMVPPVIGERLGELLPGARFDWLEGSSHFAHVDTPELFLDTVLPFLEG